ncbi:MAG: hypothetical protein II013_02870 [Lachnobacterium sp.]|nr:hypothetical protein [Lachnobacterium sp.]
MNSQTILTDVKNSLGIQGNFQDSTINEYIVEVVDFLLDAGVTHDNITHGLVARGVSDLWSYGSGEGKLSSYFLERATQLSYKR